MTAIWKFHDQMHDLGDNVKIVSWLPQNDLLAHANCKLFVTHCGSNSMYESVYHGGAYGSGAIICRSTI